tara:strand:- start:184 stop:1437 length:1254 start_codon:yes stop_codon:yes gene_type:complete
MLKKYLKFSTIISLGILLGRLTGYLRELIIASQFNISKMADQVILLLTLPDLINSLLSISTLSVVMMPLMYEKKDHIKSILIDLTKRIGILALLFYISIALILYFIYEFSFWILLLISFISIIPNALTAIAVLYLQFQNRFLFTSLGTLVFNITIIGCLILSKNLLLIALGVILACILRFGFMLIDVFKSPLKIANQPYIKTNKVSFQLIIFSIISNGILFINPTINKMLASLLSPGSTAILTYAEKIYLLPVSVLLTTFAVASFPDISKLIVEKKWDTFTTLLKKSIILNIILSGVTVLIFVILGKFFITILFGLANISNYHINQIYTVFLGYIGALGFAGTQAICINVLFSLKKFKSIATFSITILSLNLLLNLVVIIKNKALVLIAINTSLLQIISVIILTILIKQTLKEKTKT